MLHQRRQDDQARALAHVVGVGLEGDAEHGDRLARDGAAAGRDDPVRHRGLAGRVAAQHGVDDGAGTAGLRRHAGEGGGVLGEAGAAEARPCVQEVAADAAVEADPPGHVLHVGAEPLAEVGDLVDEGDLGGEEAVGGVLDELRRLQRGEEHRRLDEEERPVERPHDRPRPLALGADDHAVGAHEVLDGRALAQELRVRDDVDVRIRPPLADDAGDLAPGAHRHRRLGWWL